MYIFMVASECAPVANIGGLGDVVSEPSREEVKRESSGSETPAMNATEYLEHLFAQGVTESDFPVIQPLFQGAIWERMKPGEGPHKLAGVIKELGQDNQYSYGWGKLGQQPFSFIS
jgi:Starch synthase catalytic domain